MTIIAIIAIISFCAMFIFGGIIGMSIGYGSGYEQHMLDCMTDDEKDGYYKNKGIMASISDKHTNDIR